MSLEVRHLIVYGRVQGVGFRYAMVRAAQELGITGWVANRRDGAVECMIAGGSSAVAAMRAWVERGPPGAHVVRVDDTPSSGEFAEFTIVRTM